MSLRPRFRGSNEASKEMSEIPQQGITFSSCLSRLFSPVSGCQPSRPSPSQPCSAETFGRGDGAAGNRSPCGVTGRPPCPFAPSCPGCHQLQPLLESSGKRIDALLRPNAAKTEGCSESGERSQSLLARRPQRVRERSPSMTENICVDPTPRRLGRVGYMLPPRAKRERAEPRTPAAKPVASAKCRASSGFPLREIGTPANDGSVLAPCVSRPGGCGRSAAAPQAATNTCWLLGASLQTPPLPRGCWGLAGVTEKRVFSSKPRHGAN